MAKCFCHLNGFEVKDATARAAAEQNAKTAEQNAKALQQHANSKNNPHGVTAAEVGARPSTWMPTAAEVGARPSTWMPTAEEVGARPSTWMPTAEQVGARPDTWVPTAAEIGIDSGTADTIYTSCFYRLVDGVKEWINPPALLDVEYRTTERYLGKPVYLKVVNCGAGPNATQKKVEHGVTNGVVFDYGADVYNSASNDRITLPWYEHLKLDAVSKTEIAMTSATADYSGYQVHVWIKYYKTTD